MVSDQWKKISVICGGIDSVSSPKGSAVPLVPALSVDIRELPAVKSNTMISRSTVLRTARNAALLSALITALSVAANVMRGLRERTSPMNVHTWIVAGALTALMFGSVFAILFAGNLVNAIRAQPEVDILSEETPESELLPQPLYGFVAMEFYWGIFNRTFLVMVAPEGLYGWKVRGPVSSFDRRFFEIYQEMLKDPGFPRDLPAIRKLAGLRGGFIYPKSVIASVISDGRRQWGMGGVAYSGHVYLRVLSGATRKFVVLGTVAPDEVRDRLVTALGTGITSVV